MLRSTPIKSKHAFFGNVVVRYLINWVELNEKFINMAIEHSERKSAAGYTG